MGFPSTEELAGWIGLEDADAVRALHARAYAVKEAVVGRRVSMRGLVEAGNVCAKVCRYCGIRKSFFFNEPAPTEIDTYGHTLPLHAALPIFRCSLGTSLCSLGFRHAASRTAGAWLHPSRGRLLAAIR